MRVRSWFIRGLILAGVAALAALAWLANSWVSPERVREKVIATLSEQFADIDVHVGSARMRILGGIAVSDIKLTRRGDPVDRPFLSVPSAVLYHDKEQLNRGRLVIKKVELDSPVLTLERAAGGEWNVLSAMKPGPADRPVPTFVVKNGSVTVTDRAPGALPPLALTNLQLTLLNDPLPTLTVQAGATAANYGPVTVRARYNKLTKHLSLSAEAPELPLGPAVQSAVQRVAPDLAPHLAKLTATANVSAELAYAPGGPGPHWTHKIKFAVKDARFEHPDLPFAVEKLSASVQSKNGNIKVEEASAVIAGTKVRLSLDTRGDGLPALALDGANGGGDPLKMIEDNLQRLEVHASDLPLNDALFEQLPAEMRRARKQFNPTGFVDVTYKFGREGAGWKRDLEVRPKQAGLMYEKFRYPLADVRGLVKRIATHTGEEFATVDLVGTAGGQFVTIKGRTDGPGPDPAVNLTVTGLNAPLNDELVNALPPKFAAMVRQFRASGRGDFVAKITQQPGVNLLENEFRIDIKDAKVNYTRFPYPVEQVKGRVVVRTTMTDATRPVRPGEPLAPLPDRDEMILDGITAVHGGAQVWMNGAKRPLPDSRDRKLVLKMGGTNLPVDADMRTALAAVRVESGWDALAPSGKLSFSADVEVLDRAPPADRPDDDTPFDPARDMTLTFNFAGPTVKPTFLTYEVTDLTGWLQYKNNRLDVAHLTGKHGPTRLKLSAAELRFYPDGSVWANIGAGEMKPFVADDELRKALPPKLASALNELQLKGGAELHLKHMVVLMPPDARTSARPAVVPAGGVEPPLPAPAAKPDPVIYWDAELKLFGASLDTGVPWEDVYGSVASRGRYEGTHLGAVRGNVWLDRATVSRLPVSSARCQMKVDPQSPDLARPGTFQPPVLQFLNATGDLFHGELVGQARVALTDPPRYEVWASVSNAQLDEAARHYKLGSDADLKGIAQAQLLVYNRPDPKTGQLVVEGNGKIDVPTGRMYNLPILLDLVKVLKLQTPDKTAFEQAHAVFRIQGDRVKVEQIDLIGKAICVGGSGELDTSGEFVKFEFYTVWSTVLKQLINTPVGDLTAFLSKNLFVIKMTRENGELKYKPEAVPLVTEPTKAVIDRLKRGASKVMGK